MKIIVATDSYKGSLSSLEAGNAIAEGIHKVDKTAEVIVRPIADGGEGTVEALSLGMGGSATNDGGAGMLMALGFDMLDADGKSSSI